MKQGFQVFLLSTISFITQAQLRVGDPGVTFDANKYDSRYPQMKEWETAGTEDGIPFISSLTKVKTLHGGISSAAINTAIVNAAAGASKNNQVYIYLKNGNYTIDGKIVMKSYVSLVGESRGGVVCTITMNSGDGFNFYKVKNCGIYDMTIKGSWGVPYYPWNYGLSANDELPSNDNISVKIKQSTNCWLDRVNIYNSARDPLRCPSNHITLRDLKVDGAHKKAGGAQGYFFIQGAYNLITGCEVTHLRHISLQGSKVEYNVVYDNDFKQEVSFHSGDNGNNLIENNRIVLPADMPNSKADTPGAVYNSANEPNYYAIMGAWSIQHLNSKNPNFVFKNSCLEKNHNNATPWSNPNVLYKGPLVVKPANPATNFPALPVSLTPSGNTLYPVVLSSGGGGSSTPVIADGTYFLQSTTHNQRMVARPQDNYQGYMRNAGNWSNQKWVFTHVGNNVYTLRNVGTNRYLEVPYAACANSTQVATYTSANASHQRWKVEENGGVYSLKPAHCQSQGLDRNNGVLHTNVHTYNYNANNGNQKWKIIPVSGARVAPSSQSSLVSETRIYPNPARDYVKVMGINAGDNIVVKDMQGKEVLNTKATGETQRIATSELKKGMYMMSISDNEPLKLIIK